MREIQAGRAGEGLKNYAIPTFTSPDRVDWIDYKQRNAAAQNNVNGLVQRAEQLAGNHTIFLVYSGDYLTYQYLCPDLRLALSQSRSYTKLLDPQLDDYEHAELDSFTVKRR
jgi:hypothetical protein